MKFRFFLSLPCWLLPCMLSESNMMNPHLHAAGYDRPVGDPRQGRSVVVARHGIVATSHPLAAQAGLDILKSGGNAADAAIATNAMLGLVEPASCGIGGDLFAIYWDSKTQKLYGLNASGRSPFTLNCDVFKQKGLDQIPPYGPLSWSVPGCVSGWEALSQKFGTKSWSEILSAAMTMAQTGFPANPPAARDGSTRFGGRPHGVADSHRLPFRQR